MKQLKYILIALPALIVAGCKQGADKSAEVPKRTVFFDKSGMDTTAKPGDNFFLYASGNWMKKTEIPPSQTGWGSFYTLYEDNEKNLHTILEQAARHDNDKGSAEQKVADLYTSGMDTISIEKLGYSPVKPQLEKIAAIKDYKQLITLMADGYKSGNGYLLGFYVSPDDRISTQNIAHFDQAGLGLPNRDYYFNTDSATVKIRAEYVKYITRLFTLTGSDAAAANKKAAGILQLETKIAQSHLTPTELRDPVKNYNKFALADLQKEVPDIDLKNVTGHLGLKADTVLVGQPKYFKSLDNLLKTQPVDVWKDKIAFTALNDAAAYLSKSFRDAKFDFNGRILNGQKVQRDRWKIVTDNVDGGLGELLGQLYAEKYFTADAKDRMLSLVNNLIDVSKFNFNGADQQKKVGVLSGGERNRVHLAITLKKGSNVLLLDEPTNDIDVNTLRALEEALENFGGCAVIISHDRWFLDRVCTHILAFEGNSQVYFFEGNYSDYEENYKKRVGDVAPKRIKYKKLTV
jgi:putative endopeptidase